MGGNQSESQLISQLQHGLALEFERSDPARKLRLLLSEILFVLAQVMRLPTLFLSFTVKNDHPKMFPLHFSRLKNREQRFTTNRQNSLKTKSI